MDTEMPKPALDRAIVRSAYQSLRPLLMTESAFRASVRGDERRVVRFTRARFVIERRSVVRRTQPAPLTCGDEVEPLITPYFDPWLADGRDLVRATRQHTLCTRCKGKRSRGCGSCEGSGRVFTWLESHGELRVEVEATPRDVAQHYLRSALDEDDFLEEVWLHECEQDVVLQSDALASVAPALHPTLAAQDRVRQVCLQTFAVDVHAVEYETALGSGVVEIAGSPLTVFEATRKPLALRTSAARIITLSAAVLAITAPLIYRAQHPWFEKYGAALSALTVGLGSAVLLGMALLGWLRASASRTAISTWCPTMAALGLAALSSALLATTRPSLADARDALDRRDLERATLTADALYMLGAPRSEQQLLRDDIRLARMDLTSSLASKLTIAGSEGWTPQRRPAMEGAILDAVELRAARVRALHDADGLVALAEMIRPLLPREARTLTVEAAAHESTRCILKAEPRCIEQSADKLDALGEHALATKSRRVLVSLIRQRFDRALDAVSHSRSAKVELSNLTAARILADKLAQLGAPPASGTRSLIDRGIRRTEAQIEAVNAPLPSTAPIGPLASR